MQDETSDVLSALDFLKTLPYADTKQVAMMGWSLGGMVTIFAASQSTGLRAAIDQAGGALHWGQEPAMRLALVRAAGKINIPVLAMDAENDSPESVRIIVQELERRKIPAKLIIYPPYRPPEREGLIPAGHLIFDAPGAHIWANDVLAFLAANLGGTN
jgi:dienelactone hydrolase